MPEYSRKTGERHVITLPSAIEAVRWSRRRVSPGGVVGLEVQTVFCGHGSSIEIALVDARGTTHASLEGELYNNHLQVDLQVPEGARGGLLAKVRMPNHDLTAESEALRVTKPVRVRGPRWSQETVRRGDVVTLTADARGAPEGERALVRIFEYDKQASQGDSSLGGAHDPVTRMRPRVEDGAVEVMYQFQYPRDTAEIVPEWEAPEGYVPPRFFFMTGVLGVTAASADSKARGLMTFVDELAVQIVDAESGAPFADQAVELTLADGSVRTETTDGEGRIRLEVVPPGPVKVQLPELGAPGEEGDSVEKAGSGKEAANAPTEAQDAVATRTADAPPEAEVATGSAWRVAVGLPTLPPTF